MKNISVVVPTRNRPRLLRKCLDSLVKQNYSSRIYEIIVVDDGSDTDEAGLTVKDFSKKFKNIKYFRQKKSGPATARNLGLRVSSAPIVAFIDDDCTASSKWIKSLIAAFSRNKGAWAVEGKTVTKGPIGPFSHYIINNNGGMFMTCNMAFMKKRLLEAGRFDERFKHANREDADVAFSMIEMGGRIAFSRDSLVEHKNIRSGFLRELKKKTYYMWDILLAKKHAKLYKKFMKLPAERFTLLYVLFSALAFFSPYFLLGAAVTCLAEIKYRNYRCSASDYIKFLVLQVVGSFIVLISVLYGVLKFRFNPAKLLFA